MESYLLLGLVLWTALALCIFHVAVTPTSLNQKSGVPTYDYTFPVGGLHRDHRPVKTSNMTTFLSNALCIDAGERVLDHIALTSGVLEGLSVYGQHDASIGLDEGVCNPVLLELMGRSIRRQSYSTIVVLTNILQDFRRDHGAVDPRPRVNGCDVLAFAKEQGHHTLLATYPHATNTSIMSQLRGHSHKPGDNTHGAIPGWVLFMVVDALGTGTESDMIEQARVLLEESTVTYLVIRFGGSAATITNPRSPVGTPPPVGGIALLHALRYRVQLLTSDTPLDAHGWGPNTEITSTNLHTFARHIAEMAATCYLYATQGHDLAIPSEATFRRRTAHRVYTRAVPAPSALRVVWPMVSPPAMGVDGAPEARISVACDDVHVQPTNVSVSYQSHKDDTQAEVACVHACCCPAATPGRASRVSFLSSQRGLAHVTCCATLQVACAARIVPSMRARHRAEAVLRMHSTQSHTPTWLPHRRQPPDVVVLMLDAVSRQQFQRVLPHTARVVRGASDAALAEWVYFHNYRVVGANSGPNQIALYSGMPLHGRDVAHHKAPLLWDTLRAAGYVTLKTEDGCVRNSNMLQALAPQVDHGDALLPVLFCEHHRRPHRNAGHPAGAYVLNYSTAFLDHTAPYTGVPRAAFVHLIDGHEDTRSSLGALDNAIAAFVASVAARPNTVAVVVSDHGLHYGRHYTTPAGLVEHQSPLLAVHVSPDTGPPHATSATDTSASLMRALRQHAQVAVTPYDVHATLRDLVGVAPDAPPPTGPDAPPLPLGRSLILPPQTRTCAAMGVPPAFCPGHVDNPVTVLSVCARHTCVPTAHVPSIASYYAQLNRTVVQALAREVPGCSADHPTVHRDRQLPGTAPMADGHYGTRTCRCSTADGAWHPCARPPRPAQRTHAGTARVRGNVSRAKTVPVHLTLCRNDNTTHHQPQLVIDVIYQENSTSPIPPSPQANRTGSRTRRSRPALDVVVINVHQLSKATAQRHLARTRELLASVGRTGHVAPCVHTSADGSVGGGSGATAGMPAAAVEFDVHAVLGADAATEFHALLHGTRVGGAGEHTSAPPDLRAVAAAAGYTVATMTDRCVRGRVHHTPIPGQLAQVLCALDSVPTAAQHLVGNASTGWTRLPTNTVWTFPPHRAAGPCHGTVNGLRTLRRELVFAHAVEALSEPKGAPVLALVDVGVANDNDMVTHEHPLVAAADVADFDEQLQDLLCTLTAPHTHRSATDGTLVVVRGRGGDMPLGDEHDWSTIVEARTQYMGALVIGHTQDVVAAAINITAAAANRMRLVTTLDVHATIKHVILGKKAPASIKIASTNSTVYDLPIPILLHEVPASRQCKNTHIPLARCPCGHEHAA